ncbi:MAG TPA: chromosomal replication initiator protein DnaA, partial [Micavibrio sp.]
MADISGGVASALRKDKKQADSFTPTPEILDLWNDIHGALRGEFGEAVFRSWLKPLTLQAYYLGTMEVSVPTRFMRDWIQTHYSTRILEMCATRNAEVKRLEIVVVQNAVAFDGAGKDGIGTQDKKAKANQNQPILGDDGQALSSPFDPRFTFETFIVGKPNALAHAAARRVAESQNVPFNPLFIYGGVGLGKTHLMHAIGWSLKKQAPERQIMYLSAEKFMYQFVRALRVKDTMAFKEAFRNVDVLMIDDIQFISGKESTQEEFFHTFNALVDQNKQIVISSDKAPSDLLGLEERLRSRLAWGLVADIHPSTYELRLGIMQSKRELLNAAIPDAVLEFLALKVTSNIRELEGALNR